MVWASPCRPMASGLFPCSTGWPISRARRAASFPVRLVKGAYWDTEIKRAQEAGSRAIRCSPARSRRMSVIWPARGMLAGAIFLSAIRHPQRPSIAAITVMAGNDKRYEFQRLHGMGQPLYAHVVEHAKMNQPGRIYAPVGSHEDLLAYLVRRLLENGANTSFVNRLADDDAPIEEIVADPVEEVLTLQSIPHPRIPLPRDIFAPRANSSGYAAVGRSHARKPRGWDRQDFAQPQLRGRYIDHGQAGQGRPDTTDHHRPTTAGLSWGRYPRPKTMRSTGAGRAANAQCRVGPHRRAARAEHWSRRPNSMKPTRRTDGSARAGGGQDPRQRSGRPAGGGRFPALLCQAGPPGFQVRSPAGANGRSRTRCRFTGGASSPASPRGISRWRSSPDRWRRRLAAGNAVIAKPAEQTPLVACEAVKLLHGAGVPRGVLHFLPGDGARIGKRSRPSGISGVAFTGSNETAAIINRSLAARDGANPALIAETGGMNAMIVDSSALPEQAVRDVLARLSTAPANGVRRPAFCLSRTTSRPRFPMLKGAMTELTHRGSARLFDRCRAGDRREAKETLETHKARMARAGERSLSTCRCPPETVARHIRLSGRL